MAEKARAEEVWRGEEGGKKQEEEGCQES